MEDKSVLTTYRSSKLEAANSRLTRNQIAMIEEAIAVVGDFGEIHLVVNNGRLHYITAQKSFNARNYRPGMITAEFDRGED